MLSSHYESNNTKMSKPKMPWVKIIHLFRKCKHKNPDCTNSTLSRSKCPNHSRKTTWKCVDWAIYFLSYQILITSCNHLRDKTYHITCFFLFSFFILQTIFSIECLFFRSFISRVSSGGHRDGNNGTHILNSFWSKWW